MITNFKFKNCFAFDSEVELNLNADMRTKRFPCNVINCATDLNALKSVAIYGPNNTGKTCLIKCIRAIKDTLLNKTVTLESNMFIKSSVCELSMSFIYKTKEYLYEFKYDEKSNSYIYEKMCEIKNDKYGNKKHVLLFLKDTINDNYECPSEKELEQILNISSNNNILIYTVQTEKFKLLSSIKEILTEIAKDIEIVDMNQVPLSKTIDMLKNKDEETKKIVEFIKNADLYLNDYMYDEDLDLNVNVENESDLNNPNIMDQIKLSSVYKNKKVPSIIYDSLGTKKVEAIASYIIEAIEKGKVLVIDELDSSLHFKITRAIVSMFNNDANKNAQLIATLYDISLLDCKKMFRKEQIYFTNKDEGGIDLYSLKDFSYAEDGIRGDTSNIQEKYSKGLFGAIPDPDLISTLIEVNDK